MRRRVEGEEREARDGAIVVCGRGDGDDGVGWMSSSEVQRVPRGRVIAPGDLCMLDCPLDKRNNARVVRSQGRGEYLQVVLQDRRARDVVLRLAEWGPLSTGGKGARQ